MKDLWALQWEQKLLQEGRAANEWPSGGYGDITCHFSREFSSAREQYGKERTGQGHHRLQHGEREEERRQSPRGRGGGETDRGQEGRQRKSKPTTRCSEGVVAAPAGHRVPCSKSPPGTRNKDSKLLLAAAAQGGVGSNAYFACASYVPSGRCLSGLAY